MALHRPDPSGIGEDSHANARRLVRVAVTATAILAFAHKFVLFSPVAGKELVAALVGVVQGLVATVGEWYRYKFFRHLAMRIPEPNIASRADTLRSFSVFAYGLMAAGLGFVLFGAFSGGKPAGGMSASPRTNPAFVAGSVIAGAGALVVVFLSLFSLLLIVRLRRGVVAQAAAARQIWNERLITPAPPPPSPPPDHEPRPS